MDYDNTTQWLPVPTYFKDEPSLQREIFRVSRRGQVVEILTTPNKLEAIYDYLTGLDEALGNPRM